MKLIILLILTFFLTTIAHAALLGSDMDVVHRIKGSDGNIHRVRAPENANPDDLVFLVEQQIIQKSQSDELSDTEPQIKDLYEALRKAQAAGDVEAAKELDEYIQARMSNSDTVKTQKIEQPTKPVDVGAAYINAAKMALVIGVLWYVIFKILMPKKWKATNSIEMGRVWLAWSVGLSLVSAVNWYKKSGFSEASAMFLVTLIFLGPLSFLFGWLYGKYFKFTDTLQLTMDDKSPGQIYKTEIIPDNNSYLLAMEEYDSDKRDKSLWAKCFALSEGDETKTKSTYIKERADTFSKSNQTVSSN